MDQPEPLSRPEELDRLLRWLPGRAQKLARRGKLPHVVLPDGAIRFRLPEVLALLEHRDADGCSATHRELSARVQALSERSGRDLLAGRRPEAVPLDELREIISEAAGAARKRARPDAPAGEPGVV